MISPPVTRWPANTFTPSRLAAESRPLREEPSPFLCAIAFLLGGSTARSLARAAPACRALARLNLRDLDPRQLLPVTGAALVAALGLELDDAQLGTALVRQHARLDPHLGPRLAAVDHLIAVHIQQRFERAALSFAHGQALDQQGLAALDAVLL